MANEKVTVRLSKSGKTIEATHEEFAKLRNTFPSAKIVQTAKARPPVARPTQAKPEPPATPQEPEPDTED